MTSTPLFSARHLSKSFAGRPVVQDFSFELFRGQCLGVIGPNGAGKTTTLRMCLGLTAADVGEISVLGYRLPEQARQAKHHIGVVSQFDSLDPDFTVVENLQVFGRYFGLSRAQLAQKVPELLEFSALEHKAHARPGELSGGMKRRLSLARALVNDPDILFLDEPTTGLDPQARHLIWERLFELLRRGKAIVLTTHFMDEAQRLSDQLIVMDRGLKLAEGSPRELIASQVEPEVIEVFGGAVAQWLEALRPLAARVELQGETVFAYGNDLSAALQWVEQHSQLQYVHRRSHLEDVFLKLTGRQLRED